MSTVGQGPGEDPGRHGLFLSGPDIEPHQPGHPLGADMERRGDETDLFPGVRNLSGFDGLPLRNGQGGQRSNLLEGPAVPPAGHLDMLAEDPGADLGTGCSRAGGSGGAI